MRGSARRAPPAAPSASTISARPSLVESANSRSMSVDAAEPIVGGRESPSISRTARPVDPRVRFRAEPRRL